MPFKFLLCALAAGAVVIPVPTQAATLTWDASGNHAASPTDGAGTWSTTGTNWSNGASDAGWNNTNQTDIAVFGNGGTAGTVTVSGGVNVGGITFNPVASGTYYTIAGSTITLFGGGAITVSASNAVINSVLAGSVGLTTSGTGTLTLGGSNTYTGATNVNGGTLVLGAGSSITNNGEINVGNSGAGTLTVSGGTITNTAGSPGMEIGVGGAGTFNLTSGTASFSGGYLIAGAGGSATFNQSGGVFNLTNSNTFYLGNSASSPVTVNLSGGTFTMSGGTMQVGVRSNTSLNISGSASVSISTVQLGNSAAASGLSNQFNLNGGTLITNGIAYSTDTFTSSLNGGTLQAGASTASLWSNNASVTATIGASGFTVNTAGFNDTISQVFGGTGALTNIGTGTLTLSGANTFSGGVVLTNGTLNTSADSGMGASTGSITFNGGSYQAGGSFASSRPVVINGGITGTIDTQANTLTLSGSMTGATGALTKIGGGTLVLSGSDTYGGTTTINNGTLRVNSALPNSAVTVNNGGGLGGTGTVGQLVTVNGGGAINLVDGSIGTLTLGSGLAIGNNATASIMDFEGSGSSFDLLNDSASALTINGAVTVNITALNLLNAGTYNLITFGSLTGSLGNFTLSSNFVNGDSLTLLSTGTAEQLVVASILTYWKGGNGTSWSATGPTNWTSNAAGTSGTSAPNSHVNVVFSANGVTGPLTTSLGANFDVASLNFASGATGSTTISDGTYGLTLEGGGISVSPGAGAVTISATGVTVNSSQSWINNSSNALTVTSPVLGTAATSSTTTLTLTGSGAGVILLGGAILDGTAGGKLALNINESAGTATLTASNSYSGGTTISAGTLQLGDGVSKNGIVTGGITDNGTLVIANPLAQTLSNVVSGSGAVVKSGAGSLTLGSNTYTGSTTIQSGTLILNGNSTSDATGYTLGNGSSGASSVTLQVSSGFNSNNESMPVVGNSLRIINVTVSGSAGGTNLINVQNAGTNPDLRLVLGGPVTLQGPKSQLFSFVSGTGVAAGATALTLDVNGGNFVYTSDGIASTFSGNVHIMNSSATAGQLQMQNDAYVANDAAHQNLVFPDTASVQLDSNINWAIFHGVETIDALTGAGTIDGGPGDGTNYLPNTPVLTVGAANGSGTFSGAMTNNGGSFSLGKTGTGTEVLTGANTYVGGTVINQGTLQIGTGGTNGSLYANGAVSGSAGGTLVFDLSNAVDLNYTISGGIGLTQAGSGTLTIDNGGAYAYTGTTTVANGTVIVAGNIGGGGPVSVLSGTLGGGGNIAGNATIGSGATLYSSAGGAGVPSQNQLSIGGNLSLSNSSSFQFSLDSGSPGTSIQFPGNSDDVLISGSLTLAGTVTLSGFDIGSSTLDPNSGDVYVIADASQGINGAFANSRVLVGQNWFAVSYQPDGFGGMDVVLTVAAVPEPRTYVTLLAGLALLSGLRYRRRIGRMVAGNR